MTYIKYTPSDCTAFFKACTKHGVRRDGCGLHARDALWQLQKRPVTAEERRRGIHKITPGTIGQIIAAKLAIWNPAKNHWQITDEGRQWLRELTSKGL
jgi:hypothetical protein